MRKLVLFAVPFGVAALVYVYLLSAPVGLILGGAAAIFCLVCCLLHFNRKKLFAILAAGLAAGLLWSAGYELLLLRPLWTVDGQKTSFEATVLDYPTKTANGCKVKTEIKVNGRTAKTLLYLYDEMPEIAPGDTIHMTATLHKTKPAADDKSDYYDLSIGCALRAYGSDLQVEKCAKTPLRFFPAVFSGKLRAALSEAVPADAAPFLQALITGDKSGLSAQTMNEISDAGFSHVIAISGMHVSILVGVIYFLTRKNSLLSTVLGIPVILFFTLMTGGSPSVVRAGIMQTMMLLAPLFRRETDGATSLCAALLVILLGNPNAAASVSFQLSFAAVAGIYLCTQRIYAYLSKPEWMQKLLKNRLTRPPVFFLLSCTATTLGALLFTLPLCALHFGTISIYTLLSNLLVLSVISACFALGLLAGLLGLFWLPAAKAVGWVIAWPVRYILWVAGVISKLPFAALSATTPYVAIWLLFLYVFILLAVLQKEKKPVLLTCVCIFVSLGVSLLYTHLDMRGDAFSVAVLDVGQGECICMQSGDFTAMVDCGGSSGYEAASAANDYLELISGGHLDCLLLTHYDTDHVNGAKRLLELAEVETLYLPDVEDAGGTRSEIEHAAAENGTKIIYVTRDITLYFSNGTMSLFAPVSHYDDNAACLSVLFSAADYDMLITGDMDFYSEYDLLLSHELPDVELFIAGHHGSATSSSEDLLAQIRPETVVISVGENNRYGHPTQEALARFAAIGAEVYRTDECGTITIGR